MNIIKRMLVSFCSVMMCFGLVAFSFYGPEEKVGKEFVELAINVFSYDNVWNVRKAAVKAAEKCLPEERDDKIADLMMLAPAVREAFIKSGGLKEIVILKKANPADVKNGKAIVTYKLIYKYGRPGIQDIYLIKRGESWFVCTQCARKHRFP